MGCQAVTVISAPSQLLRPERARSSVPPMGDGSGVPGGAQWGFCVGKHSRALSGVNPNLDEASGRPAKAA